MKKILVIDDHQITLDVIYDILADEKCYDVYTFNNVPHLNYIESINPDIILLDVLIREHDGRDICKLIRNTHTLKHVRIILFSAFLDEEKLAIESGADCLLRKPFDLEELLRIIEMQKNSSV